MAATARRKIRHDESRPPVDDQHAVRRAFVRHRRRRIARIEYRREQKWARRRFWILIGALVVLVVFLGVTIFEQIQSMFGI